MSLREAPSHPQIAARGSITDVDGILLPGPAPRFSAHPPTGPRPAPAAGQHTREVLVAAGLDADALVGAGAAVQA